MSKRRITKLALISAGGLASYLGYKFISDQTVVSKTIELPNGIRVISEKGLPSRKDMLNSLQKKEEFDILIIGGGATGSSVALDSVTRGLKTALVELNDFASGTSSKSTKLIHGGVRYLQKAILNLDYEQYRMVKEALEERANMLTVAPHITYPIPIMLPVYHWWQLPYFWVGIKAYDFVAGWKNVKSSYILTKKQALEKFPMLKSDNLCGAIVYYDGQQDDARTNMSLILTSIRYGATVANHCGVLKLYKDENGKLNGARLRDQLTGNEWDVKAKCIINATGPFTDSIRKMDNPEARTICAPSSGVHITLPGYYSPNDMGLLDPATSDGRVIFFLPWLKSTIAGTTDKACSISSGTIPTENDIQFILKEIKKYLNPDVNVRRGDVMSAWSGIRPLVIDPSKPNTESIARNHIIDESESGLITIAGGKWTTSRSMAEETVDHAIKTNERLIATSGCQTKGLLLEGAAEWTPTMFIRLVQDYGVEPEIANHLSNAYGDRAFAVCKLAELTGKRWPVVGKRLHTEFPYIEGEVRFACREYACTATDVLARRMRIAFLNVEAALEILPKVVDIMAKELNWSDKEKKKQTEDAINFLNTEMGYLANKEAKSTKQLELTRQEVLEYSKLFNSMDKEKKGYIGVNDLRRSFKASGQKFTETELHSMLSEVDINKNGQVELDEYLELMHGLKTGNIVNSRLATAIKRERHAEEELEYKRITVDRSGGGL